MGRAYPGSHNMTTSELPAQSFSFIGTPHRLLSALLGWLSAQGCPLPYLKDEKCMAHMGFLGKDRC